MNGTERALLELQGDMVRNPGGMEQAEIDCLIRSIEDESDQNLAAAAELFGLDLEALEERAGIVEYDGGVSRTTANRQATTWAIQQRDPDLGDRAARWMFENAAAVLEWEEKTGSTREQTLAALADVMHRRIDASRRVRRDHREAG